MGSHLLEREAVHTSGRVAFIHPGAVQLREAPDRNPPQWVDSERKVGRFDFGQGVFVIAEAGEFLGSRWARRGSVQS